MAVTTDEVRRVALSLPRAYEVLVRDRVKFRVGRLVFVALSRDERWMGVGFPKELRDGVIAAEPDKFAQPATSDLRYRWIEVRIAAVDFEEMSELVLDAWTMCVPARVAREHGSPGSGP